MSEWLPIDTAPRDGTWIIVAVLKKYSGKGMQRRIVKEVRFRNGYWVGKNGFAGNPAHWMPLLVDSHVKTSPTPDSKLELLMEKEVPYGGKCCDLLANYDPDTCSLKMSQLSFLEGGGSGSESSCQTWPPSGMMQSGIVYRLPTLGQSTNGSVSGLLPTPVKSDGSSPSLKQTLRSGEDWETISGLTGMFKGLFLGLKGRVKVSGTLVVNPCVTEWMMGYPIGWTELPDVEIL